MDILKEHKKLVIGVVLLFVLCGIYMRTHKIYDNDFYFFDEGYYLNFNLKAVEMIDHFEPKTIKDAWDAVYGVMRLSLGTGKALWFMVVDSRIFWGGLEFWSYPKVVSAICGIVTLLVLFFFAKKFYDSEWIALLSVLLLSIIPSHVFYSRLGIQEAMSTLFFLTAFYFYLFPKNFGRRTFFAGFLFGLVYFTNYRLIIVPVFICFTELYLWFAKYKKFDVRKLVWTIVTYASVVIIIGNIDKAQNLVNNFAWMFHQSNLAKDDFDIINFLSYPYYIFRLEGVFLGALFFSNLFFLIKKSWLKAFPFLFVCLIMVIFSLPEEKGARYLCVGLPFVAMASASLILYILEQLKRRELQIALAVFMLLLCSSLLDKSLAIAHSKTAYREAAEYLLKDDQNVKFLSTQKYVQDLYVPNRNNVQEVPHDHRLFMKWYKAGYRYMVIDPQAYISYTDSRNRFDTRLDGYIWLVTNKIKPVKTFDHFNDVIMDRFVFEHNSNLKRSISFLKNKQDEFSKIRIYEIQKGVALISRGLMMSEMLKSK